MYTSPPLVHNLPDHATRASLFPALPGRLKRGESWIVKVAELPEEHIGFIGLPRNGVYSSSLQRYSARTLRLLERIPSAVAAHR